MNRHRTSSVCLALTVVVSGCATDALRSKGPPAKSDVTLTLQRFVNLNGYQYAELTISNHSSLPVWYTGYAAVSPAYDIQYSRGNGWEDSHASGCAMGLELYELRSQQSSSFTVHLGSDDQTA